MITTFFWLLHIDMIRGGKNVRPPKPPVVERLIDPTKEATIIPIPPPTAPVVRTKDDIIRDIFKDPKLGLFSAAKIAKRIQKDYPQISTQDIQQFAARQPTTQINKDIRRGEYDRIIAFHPNDVWQADLLSVFKSAKVNKNYRYILNVIDVYSRYLWSVPLKTKSAKDVTAALAKIIASAGAPANFTTDNGKEFLNSDMKALLKKHDIKQWINQAGDHNTMGIVERVNRTIRELIRKWFSMKNTKVWYNVLDDIVENYNESEHSTLRQTPHGVYNRLAFPDRLFPPRRVKQFEKGDMVRLKTVRNIFDKPEERWSRMVYHVVMKVGKAYQVENESGDVLGRKYKPDMMLKIDAVDSDSDEDESVAIVKQDVREQKIDRKLNKAGVEVENISSEPRQARKKQLPARYRD